MHLEREAEMAGVEGNGLADVIDDVAKAGGHGVSFLTRR
jgi:hypothetical protein